jgi:6-phosphofructokinase
MGLAVKRAAAAGRLTPVGQALLSRYTIGFDRIKISEEGMAIKGNLVVGQSGGPTTVINSSLLGVVRQAMAQPEIEGIYGMLHGIRGLLHGEFIDLRKESDETLDLLLQTPASALGTVRYKVKPSDYDSIVAVFERYNVRFFFYIGGNDSMDTVYQVSEAAKARGYDLHAVGVPKTIDNDLAMTDHCPGYGSAARFVAAAIRNTGFDTKAMGDSGPLKLMEVMGRNAGWLTAATALAREQEGDPPHLIYVPECPVSEQQIADDVQAMYDRYGFCVVAVSEGAVREDGTPYAASTGVRDAFGHEVKAGVVETIAQIVEERTGMRARFDKPAYMQRAFAELQSPVDRDEAYRAGAEAVRAAVAGHTGVMITLVREPGPEYHCRTEIGSLAHIANAERMLPREFMNEAGNDVTQAFLDYARPLIGGPLLRYARLAKHPVPKR